MNSHPLGCCLCRLLIMYCVLPAAIRDFLKWLALLYTMMQPDGVHQSIIRKGQKQVAEDGNR